MNDLFRTPLAKTVKKMPQTPEFPTEQYFSVMCSTGMVMARKLAKITYRSKGESVEFILFWDSSENLYSVADYESGVPLLRIHDSSGGLDMVAKRAEKLLAEWSRNVGSQFILNKVRSARSFMVMNSKQYAIH